jgi:hypothetical protein
MTRTRQVVAALLIAAALTWIAAAQAPDNRLHVIFLDVDAGQGVIVRTPSGRYALIDGGPRTSILLSALGRYLPFWQHTIDLVVATHQGNSAVLPLTEITPRYRLLSALGPPLTSRPPAVYASWSAALAQHNVPLLAARPETSIELGGGVRLFVTHCGDASVSLLLSYGQTSVYLPGPGALSLQDREATVVAFPAGQESLAHYAAANQTVALILFTGKQDPHAPVPSNVPGIQVFSTASHGSIELISDGAGVLLHPAQ